MFLMTELLWYEAVSWTVWKQFNLDKFLNHQYSNSIITVTRGEVTFRKKVLYESGLWATTEIVNLPLEII